MSRGRVSVTNYCSHRCCGQSTSLIKTRGSSNVIARLELPNYRGRYPMRTLQIHVPGFYHRLRESGNRRVNPIDYVRHSFQNYADEPLVNLAMNWIFLHAETHELPQCLLYPKSVSIHENPIKVAMANIDEALEIDDILSALYFLDLALCICRGMSYIVRVVVTYCVQLREQSVVILNQCNGGIS